MEFSKFLTRWPFDLSWFGSSAWALFSESKFPNSCMFLIADCNKGRLELAITASMSTWVGKNVFHMIRKIFPKLPQKLNFKKLEFLSQKVSLNHSCSAFFVFMTTEISLRTFAYLLRVTFEAFLPLLFVQSQKHSLFLKIAPPCELTGALES